MSSERGPSEKERETLDDTSAGDRPHSSGRDPKLPPLRRDSVGEIVDYVAKGEDAVAKGNQNATFLVPQLPQRILNDQTKKGSGEGMAVAHSSKQNGGGTQGGVPGQAEKRQADALLMPQPPTLKRQVTGEEDNETAEVAGSSKVDEEEPLDSYGKWKKIEKMQKFERGAPLITEQDMGPLLGGYQNYTVDYFLNRFPNVTVPPWEQFVLPDEREVDKQKKIFDRRERMGLIDVEFRNAKLFLDRVNALRRFYYKTFVFWWAYAYPPRNRDTDAARANREFYALDEHEMREYVDLVFETGLHVIGCIRWRIYLERAIEAKSSVGKRMGPQLPSDRVVFTEYALPMTVPNPHHNLMAGTFNNPDTWAMNLKKHIFLDDIEESEAWHLAIITTQKDWLIEEVEQKRNHVEDMIEVAHNLDRIYREAMAAGRVAMKPRKSDLMDSKSPLQWFPDLAEDFNGRKYTKVPEVLDILTQICTMSPAAMPKRLITREDGTLIGGKHIELEELRELHKHCFQKPADPPIVILPPPSPPPPPVPVPSFPVFPGNFPFTMGPTWNAFPNPSLANQFNPPSAQFAAYMQMQMYMSQFFPSTASFPQSMTDPSPLSMPPTNRPVKPVLQVENSPAYPVPSLQSHYNPSSVPLSSSLTGHNSTTSFIDKFSPFPSTGAATQHSMAPQPSFPTSFPSSSTNHGLSAQFPLHPASSSIFPSPNDQNIAPDPSLMTMGVFNALKNAVDPYIKHLLGSGGIQHPSSSSQLDSSAGPSRKRPAPSPARSHHKKRAEQQEAGSSHPLILPLHASLYPDGQQGMVHLNGWSAEDVRKFQMAQQKEAAKNSSMRQ